MPKLRIALAQIDSTVGDLEGNSAAIIEWTRRAADQGLGGVAVVTGYLGRHIGRPPRYGQPAEGAQNAAALLHGGRVLVTSAKHHLPNYGVFDEYRYFLPGDRLPVFRLPC